MKWLDGMCFGHMKDGEVEGAVGHCQRGEADTGRLKAPLKCKLRLADLVDMIY